MSTFPEEEPLPVKQRLYAATARANTFPLLGWISYSVSWFLAPSGALHLGNSVFAAAMRSESVQRRLRSRRRLRTPCTRRPRLSDSWHRDPVGPEAGHLLYPVVLHARRVGDVELLGQVVHNQVGTSVGSARNLPMNSNLVSERHNPAECAATASTRSRRGPCDRAGAAVQVCHGPGFRS